jgi:hypothetical protein
MNNGKKEKERKEMGEEKTETAYPVKSLHDFLFELDMEWSKFRNGTLIGLISSGFLFVVVMWLILIIRRSDLGVGALLFLAVASVFLAYSIYAMYSQYRFFNKWERRIGLLLHLEEEILAGKLDSPPSS